MTQAESSTHAEDFYRDLRQTGMSARKAEVLVKHHEMMGKAKTQAQVREMAREYIEALTRVGFTDTQAKIIADFRAFVMSNHIKQMNRRSLI